MLIFRRLKIKYSSLYTLDIRHARAHSGIARRSLRRHCARIVTRAAARARALRHGSGDENISTMARIVVNGIMASSQS